MAILNPSRRILSHFLLYSVLLCPLCLRADHSLSVPHPTDTGAFLSSRVPNVAAGAFLHYLATDENEFREWMQKQDDDLNRFKQNMLDLYGYFREPNNKQWVEYSVDCTSVSFVDFESGIVTVEALVDTGATREKIIKVVQTAVRRTVTSRGKTGPVPLELPTGDSAEAASLLAEQVADPKGTVVNADNVDALVKSMLCDSLGTSVNGTPSGTHEIVRMQFSLVPDHVRRRMMPYLPVVRRYCRRYNLVVSRVLATIHTESCFNPTARSERNAIGLMQLVPNTAGLEAYRAVYGKEVIPSTTYLFDPERNIELGCAYIHLLKNRYFGTIADQDSRLYCSIAAYNAGPGSVAFAFTGKRTIGNAATVINTMKDAKSVYDHMITSLPFAETRQYLAIVLQRMSMYED